MYKDSLPDDITVIVVSVEAALATLEISLDIDDSILDKSVEVGRGTGRMTVAEVAEVLMLESAADVGDDGIDGSVLVEVAVTIVVGREVALLAADGESALKALESTLVTDVVTVEMALGIGTGTGMMTGTEILGVGMLATTDETTESPEDVAVLLLGRVLTDWNVHIPEAAAEKTLFTTAAALVAAIETD